MFAFCDRIEDIEIFDINTAVTNKMSFFAMFYYCSSLVGTNLSVWGTKFSQNVGLDSSSDVSASSMFRNTGYNSAGLKVDFTTMFLVILIINYIFAAAVYKFSTYQIGFMQKNYNPNFDAV